MKTPLQALPESAYTMPSEQDTIIAQETSRKLATHFHNQEKLTVLLTNPENKPSEPIELPASVVRLLLDLLDEIAQGNAVTIMPIHAELTTQQAADLLNVSRPYLIHLLETKQIDFRKVGTHRRIMAKDVFAYKREIENKRRKALDELSALDQEFGFE